MHQLAPSIKARVLFLGVTNQETLKRKLATARWLFFLLWSWYTRKTEASVPSRQYNLSELKDVVTKQHKLPLRQRKFCFPCPIDQI